MIKDQLFKTKNIKFCAYLRLKKIYPSNVDSLARGKAVYHYRMAQEDWHKLKLDFDRSEFIEYGNCLDAIKDLAY